MSLDWRLDKIKDYENLCFVPTGEKKADGTDKVKLASIAEGLIWTCMVIDMGGITAKNAEEFARRTMIVEQALGPMLSDGKDNDYYLTLADVQAHVGLSTNVHTKGKVQFRTILERKIERDARDRARVRKIEAEETADLVADFNTPM